MIPTREEMQAALEKRQGKLLTDRLLNSAVAVCGLGGLGSNISVCLARAGVGKLILIDFDRVDITNLHRQQYKADQVGEYKTKALSDNLKEIFPYVCIESHNVKITEENVLELLKDADIICEAFDNPECKAMLVDAVMEKRKDKYLVAASGMAGLGSPNDIKTRRITDKLYICGDGISDVNQDIGLVASRVMLCAAHQAQTIIRILAGKYEV